MRDRLLAREASGRKVAPTGTIASGPTVSWPTLLGLALAIYLAVLAGKFAVIERYGSDVPYMDQWAGEAILAYQPMLETGSIPLDHLVYPHNEHRIATTRAFTALITHFNGQWDPQLQMTANAAVQAIVPVLLLLLVGRRLPAGALLGFSALLAVVFGLPVSRENLLISFQVQFFFAQVLGLLFVWGSLAARPLGPVWWAAQLCGLLDIFSMANGGIRAAAVLAVMGVRAVRARRVTVREIGAGVVLIAMAGIGFATVAHVPAHDALRAASSGAFLQALGQTMSWPWADAPWMSVVLWAPGVVLLGWIGRSRRVDTTAWVLLGLGAGCFLMDATLAYARAPAVLASRYFDQFLFALCINAAALLWLVSVRTGRLRWAAGVGVTAWMAIAFTPVIRTSWNGYRELPAEARLREAQGERLARFVREGDRSAIADAPEGSLPLPNGARHYFFEVLENPALRSALPPSLREWVPFTSEAGSDRAPQTSALPESPQGEVRSVAARDGRVVRRVDLGLVAAGCVLQFYLAGEPGAGEAEVRLVRSQEGRERVSLSQPVMAWKKVHLPVPNGPFHLELEARGKGAWVAMTQPVEVGRLAWRAHHLREQAGLLALGAALLAGAAVVYYIKGPRQPI